MKGFTPLSLEKQKGVFQKRGDRKYRTSLTINVKILAKLDPTITLFIRSSRTELERKNEAYPK